VWAIGHIYTKDLIRFDWLSAQHNFTCMRPEAARKDGLMEESARETAPRYTSCSKCLCLAMGLILDSTGNPKPHRPPRLYLV